MADHLLEIASQPAHVWSTSSEKYDGSTHSASSSKVGAAARRHPSVASHARRQSAAPLTTILTQFEVLCKREARNVMRDKSLLIAHIAVASVIGVFVGGIYYQTDTTIAGFQVCLIYV